MGCHVKIVPVRVTRREGDLGCYVRSTVGYRAVCSCGERGAVRDTVRVARAWRAEHVPQPQPWISA